MRYKFNGYTLDGETRELSHQNEIVHVEPQVFTLLELLVSTPEKIITKDDINTHVWQGRIVSEAAVNSRMRSARLAVGDNGREQKLIKTIHGVGFRFIAEVSTEGEEPRNTDVSADNGRNQTPSSLAPSSEQNPSPLMSVTDKARNFRSLGRLFGALAAIFVIVFFIIIFFNRHSVSHSENGFSQTTSAPASTAEANSIAVLPFADMSDTSDQVYFGDGVAEEILNLLAGVNSLQVSSRTSAFVFRDGDRSVSDIANALGVKYVVEGSIRKFGDDIRITAQLIDATQDMHLWSNTYDATLSAASVFDIQTEISQNIVQALSLYLPISIDSGLPAQTQSTPAYDAYLRAQALQERRNKPALEQALEQYNAAIKADPNFALAYAGRAQLHYHRSTASDDRDEAIINAMRQDIGAATALAPDLAETLYAASLLAFFENRYSDVVRISDVIIKRFPNFAKGYETSGEALLKLGRLKDAAAVLETGLALNPLSPFMLNLMADTQLRLGNFDQAYNLALSNYQWNPDNSYAMDMLGYLHWNEGRYAKAHEIYKAALSIDPSESYISDALIMIYSELGMAEVALSIAPDDTAKAFAYAMTGQAEAALSLLRKNDAETGDPSTDGETFYMAGDIERAAELMGQQVIDEDMLSIKPISPGNGDLYAEACFIYSSVSHNDAAPLCHKVKTFYHDKEPDFFIRASDVVGGAVWWMTQNDPARAITWLTDLNRRKKVDAFLLADPAFAPLKETTDYQLYYQKMMDILAPQRALVEAQLRE